MQGRNEDNILDYLIKKKNIQKEKEKDKIINKQQADLLALSNELIRISNENSELRKTISLKHDVELKLKDAEFLIQELQEMNKRLIIDGKYQESKLNKKIDDTLLEKQYEKMKFEKSETLYFQKMSIMRQIELENDIYREEVQNLKRQIEILHDVTKNKLRQIEVENKIKYNQLKKKMMEHLKETKIKLSKLNLEYLDSDNRLTMLQNYQLLMELEIQKSENEKLIKENDNLQKKLFELKSNLNIHEKVAVKLARKIKNNRNRISSALEKNSNIQSVDNEIIRANSAFFIYKKNNGNMTLISEKLKRIKGKGNSKRIINDIRSRTNSYQKMNKTQNISFSSKSKKEDFEINDDININNRILSSEDQFKHYINYMKDKKKENIKLNLNNEILKLKIAQYEQKYKGLFNFLEESIDNFYRDIKNNIMKINTIKIDVDHLKNFNFSDFSKEEQYSLLVLLMNYLLPLIYSNFNSNYNIGKNNIFTTNLNIIDRTFNKTYKYLNDKILRKAFVGKDNKLYVELYMDKILKNNFCNSIPVLRRNNSSKMFLNKKSKLLV